MRQFIGLLLLAIVLVSCNKTYNVKLDNGSVVQAEDYHNRRYADGDTVCVTSGVYSGWSIDDNGMMKDTIIETYIYRKGIVLDR